MRIGLAGAGRIGARHAETLRTLPGVDALVLADADPERARALGALLSARSGVAGAASGTTGAAAGAAGRGEGSPDTPRDASRRGGVAGGASTGGVGTAAGRARGAAGAEGAGGVARAAGRPVGAAGGAEIVVEEAVDALFAPGAGLDGLVVAAATDAHADLVVRAVRAGMPVFCEKPLAGDLSGTVQVLAAIGDAPVQVGFQRRFDAGHRAVREAVASGRLGWIHTLRSCTFDPAPPPREYVPGSGGLFRDCGVHDYDAIRYVTGREVLQVMAVGANRGDAYFGEFGDVDTATALLVLDDGTVATASASRYNAAGYDVRLEVFGSKDGVVAGLDEHTPLTPVGAPGPAAPYSGFLERFADAYDAELAAFVELAAGRRDNPCPPAQALEAFLVAEACDLSRRRGGPVTIAEVRERAGIR
ncbi:Gfo/Idh/MocA family protein [Thermomonospora umbrina]|uniref:Myo-inositol 2-dehydrogenase/D-chiro-inositol 1-dehydrogenase n=1 Tax=Thermomonospora umbrina TaxID=111806 RepID=A0A3D9SMF4_9ACTN|nr:Gfo/Idh/MocA family oxidoreductase [Thermomonospora umbrina]REE95113.1 myo-inositol 2-dehydrogenase/D-chiro-inositol 1-dehydrogenase [Thermomonospora umbrina]